MAPDTGLIRRNGLLYMQSRFQQHLKPFRYRFGAREPSTTMQIAPFNTSNVHRLVSPYSTQQHPPNFPLHTLSCFKYPAIRADEQTLPWPCHSLDVAARLAQHQLRNTLRVHPYPPCGFADHVHRLQHRFTVPVF